MTTPDDDARGECESVIDGLLLVRETAPHEAALEAAQRDAGRYRYLCSLSNADWNRFGRVPDNEVDAAIDAAISAGGEKGETT